MSFGHRAGYVKVGSELTFAASGTKVRYGPLMSASGHSGHVRFTVSTTKTGQSACGPIPAGMIILGYHYYEFTARIEHMTAWPSAPSGSIWSAA